MEYLKENNNLISKSKIYTLEQNTRNKNTGRSAVVAAAPSDREAWIT